MVIFRRRFFQILTIAASLLMFTILYTSNDSFNILHNIQNLSREEYTQYDNRTMLLFQNNNETPFKIFIYNLSSEFNTQFEQCAKHGRSSLNNSGFGKEVSVKHGEMIIMDTFQYATEVIIHQKLLASPYRTFNPNEADVFYIPYYITLQRVCSTHKAKSWTNLVSLMEQNKRSPLKEILQSSQYYKQGKLHFMAHSMPDCMMRAYNVLPDWLDQVLVLGVEAVFKPEKYCPVKSAPPPFLAVPYPSYGHVISQSIDKYSTYLLHHERQVFIFIAALRRGSVGANPERKQEMVFRSVRHQVMTRFIHTTTLPISAYYLKKGYKRSKNISSVCFEPKDPNQGGVIMEWMRNSVFCLQPPGDSPTRKSFYDSILSGCIPVLFETKGVGHIVYPFENVLDYSEFTVTVPAGKTFRDVLKPYEKNPTKVRTLQQNILKVMQYLQYSYPVKSGPHDDAMQLIMDEIKTVISRQK